MAGKVLSFEPDRTDERSLRDALGCFATGVAVVTTRATDGKFEGLTVSSFSPVSLDPPLVLWSLARKAPSMASFSRAPFFVVNVLCADQEIISRNFATPHRDKFATVAHSPGLGGCPLLDDALATFECSVETTSPGGDHVVFIGKVERAAYRPGRPLIFSTGRYYTSSPLE